MGESGSGCLRQPELMQWISHEQTAVQHVRDNLAGMQPGGPGENREN